METIEMGPSNELEALTQRKAALEMEIAEKRKICESFEAIPQDHIPEDGQIKWRSAVQDVENLTHEMAKIDIQLQKIKEQNN